MILRDLQRDDVGHNRAERTIQGLQLLNPNVAVNVDESSLRDRPASFYNTDSFDVVIATDLPLQEMASINAKCRLGGSIFFGTSVTGLNGFFFADLGAEHVFEEEHEETQPGLKEKIKVMRKVTENFVPLQAALDRNWAGTKLSKHQSRLFFRYLVISEFHSTHGRFPESAADIDGLRAARDKAFDRVKADPTWITDEVVEAMARDGCAIGPVCAIVGGILAAEVIKAISQKDAPHNNFFFYDGATSDGKIARIG